MKQEKNKSALVIWGLIILIGGIIGISNLGADEAPKANTFTPVPVSTPQQTTETPKQTTTTTAKPTPTQTQSSNKSTPQTVPPQDNCDPNYSPCIPNVAYDLDCPDIAKQVRVIGVDRHRFDRDKDGWGCETYR